MALTPFARIAGSASAVLGFLQTTGCALGAFAVSALLDPLAALAFPAVMAAAGSAAAISFVCLQPKAAKPELAADDPAVGELRTTGARPSPSLPGGR